ncbi:Plexin-B2 MM1 [Collichthys lucidus]|uniref:Plexin-B2 MM1 n=1 Tax=Collichthys lucidus TaxID=240159 RepID=A0A4U5VR96_COLLU|nr:Plexin-B2 MM1 [Collichthys lucidus]
MQFQFWFVPRGARVSVFELGPADMMERWWAWQFALIALVTVYLSPSLGKNMEFLSDTLINNVVSDPRTGRLYVGAVNFLYQLKPDLEVESRIETGPKRDNRHCTPPVTDACEEAVDTDNHNKLLLVQGAKDVLVVCGSVFRGICSLRNLSNVDQLLYFSDTKGEKSYVASAEESVSVVGKGYGSHDSTKLISTRILQDYGDWVVFDSIIEASAVQANPFVLRYLHDFRFAFKDGGFVYFLFSRTLGVQDNKNFTFISRMCEDDQGYYSYTELQLNCSATNKYNKAQAAYVATPGEVLARSMTKSGQYGHVLAADKVLFVTFTSDEDPSTSAMCMYPLSSINKRLVEIIGACYSDNGIIKERVAVYSPYSSKSEELCSSNNQKNMAIRYKCGAEFLPSPMASKAEFALTAEPPLVRKGHMSAVAVAVEMGHAVAFVGTATGEVLKVHLSNHSEVYGRAPGEITGDKVNKNLLFDSSHQHLYITTEKKITKVPVQACHLKTDCHSCVSMKDPYCGWCVLEGKCTRKQECSRSAEKNTWLWSPDQKCVQIDSFNPPNLSCKKTQQIDIHIPDHPPLRPSDSLQCVFGSVSSIAVINTANQVVVTCSLPETWDIPPTPEQQDYVSVPVKVMVNDRIEVTSGECIACVTSEWGCQWNAEDHSCSDRDDRVDGEHIVKPQQSDSCPQFESPVPDLIPVGYEIPINFQGRNLDIYMGRRFTIGTELMKHTDKEVIQEQGSKFKFTGYEFTYDKKQEVNVSFHIKERDTERKIDSTLTVKLYNCSVGREDCSLCKHADAAYQCVWCAATRSCVYRELCTSPQPAQCPNPEITDIIPHFGPLNGRISVTIKGSNMGIKKEDIKKITVAGVDCVHQVDRYSVSTSVVCEIGPAKRAPPSDIPSEPTNSGAVEIEVEGERRGTSQVIFTYRFVQEAFSKNDTTLYFLSPPVNCCHDIQSLRTVLHLDNVMEDLKGFDYHPNPSFNQLAKNVITETSIIIVTGRGFSKAMTAKEAQAYVGDALCHVNILQDDKLILEAPSTQPKSRSKRQRRDTTNNLLDLVVQFGHGEWLVGSVYYARKDDIPLVIIIPAVIVPMLLFIAVSVYCYRRKSQQAEREYEKVKHQLENLEESVRDRCKKEFTVLKKKRPELAELAKTLLEVSSVGAKQQTQHKLLSAGLNFCQHLVTRWVHRLEDDATLTVCLRYVKSCQHDSAERALAPAPESSPADLMIEMEDHTSDLSEARIPFLDYKNYTDRNFFLPSKDGANDAMITRKIQIPEARRAIVAQALNQFSNLLNSKTFLINFIRTLESRPDFNARARGYFASLLTVALHGKLEYYTDIMRTLLLELMDEHVQNKNPKLMLRRSETVVERMLCNWMSICLYQFLRDTAGEPLYKLFKALKHQVEKGPVDAKMKKAKYTLNDTGLLGDDVEYSVLTLQVLVHGEGPDVTPVKVLNCDTISQVKEKIIDQVYRNLPYSQRPKVESVALEWRPGSTGQILSDLDLTSQKEGRWKRLNTLAHYNVLDSLRGRHRDYVQVLDSLRGRHGDYVQVLDSLRGRHRDYVQVLDSLRGRHGDYVQVLDSLRGRHRDYVQVLDSLRGRHRDYVQVLDSLRGRHRDYVQVLDSLRGRHGDYVQVLDSLRGRHRDYVQVLDSLWGRHGDYIQVRDNATLVLSRVLHTQSFHQHQDSYEEKNSLLEDDNTFHLVRPADEIDEVKSKRGSMKDKAMTKAITEIYLTRLLSVKQFVDDFFRSVLCSSSIVPPAVKYFFDFLDEQALRHDNVDEETLHIWKTNSSRFKCSDIFKHIWQHTDKLNTQVALHQLYQYASKYYDDIIQSLDEDPAAQNKQLTLRLQQIAAALENKVTDL